MGILQLLARQNYITYHKTLAKEIGVGVPTLVDMVKER